MGLMDVSTDLVVGSLFAGRYRIVRRIAAGGMGAVYEVIHVETERRRALKIMHAHLFQSDELRERFKREAKVAAHIESEFIVDVFDAGIDEATCMPFLVMEFLRGEELGERLKREGRLSPAEVLTYLHQIALALDTTHEASIVHRDLKPANIFLTERADGGVRVKILDFGIAKIIAEGATTGGATQSLGTPLYMAPEQFNPSMRLTGAADIFALGMMTYTLLVGVPYWADEARAGNVYALIAVAIHGPNEAATSRAARRGVTLPAEFDGWFSCVTATAAVHRFPTAIAAVHALAEVFRLPPPQRAPMLSVGHAAEPTSRIVPAAKTLPLSAAAAGTVAQTKTTSASFPEATISGASSTTPTPAKRRRVPPFVMFGAGVGLVGIAMLAVMALRQTTGLEGSQASAPMPTVMPSVESATPAVLPSAAMSDSARPEVQPAPSATASVIASSEPRRTPAVVKPPPTKKIHVWDD